MTPEQIREIAEKAASQIRSANENNGIVCENLIETALRKVHDEAIETAATLIQDWHVPKKGGTHQMAFEIRALKLGGGK